MSITFFFYDIEIDFICVLIKFGSLGDGLSKETSDDAASCWVAHNTGEAISLIGTGFEYLRSEYADGGKLFRKRK